MQKKEFFIGIDVSKLTLDVAIYGMKAHIRISNSSEGFKQLLSWLKSFDIALCDCWVIMEYTGGYEYRLVQFCTSKDIAFTRVPGLQIKKSLGMQRGKNDKIDAKRIADYGFEKQAKIKAQPADNELTEKIKRFLTQRSGFINDRKANEHRMKEIQAMMDIKDSDELIKNYKQAVDFAQKMIDKAEEAIIDIVASDENMSRNYKLITTIPGIGKVNAWMTIAYTGNFTKFENGRQYAANGGVVPYDHTSGTSIKSKSRVSHMANKEIKAQLTMAAKASIAHDPEIKQYYERRAEKNKHHMSIINEVKFKLILRMFAVVNNQKDYVKKAA